MTPGELLRELDRRVVPVLADGLVRLAGRGDLLRRRIRALPAGRGPSPVLAIGLGVAVAATGVLWPAPRRSGDERSGDVRPVRVGVRYGQSVPGYLRASRDELATLVSAPPQSRPVAPGYALVTLTQYLAPSRVAPVLAGVSSVELYARVPLRRRATEIVHIPVERLPTDASTGMARVADRKLHEEEELLRLSAKLDGDGQTERRLRAAYHSSARLARDEAEAYRSGCACLYAAVVRATPGELARVARRPEVRAVDPAPEVRSLGRAVFLPPLPEQSAG